MNYVLLGKVDSEQEFLAALAGAKGNRDRLCELAELLRLVEIVESQGFAGQHDRWSEIEMGSGTSLKIYVGDRSSNPGALWAAFALGENGRSLTLLKMIDTYSGGTREMNDLLQDAMDRNERGERHD